MTRSPLLDRIHARLLRWRGRDTLVRSAGDERGVAVVEFALLLPLLIVICFGGAELANAIEHHRKVMLYTRVVADLSGRAEVGSMDPIFNAARVVLLPYDVSKLEVRVSAIGVQKKGSSYVGSVCSSAFYGNTTARARGEVAGTNGMPNVPEGFFYDKSHYILAEVKTPYRPILGANLFSSIFGATGPVFSKQMPWADRSETEVVLPGGSKCSF